VEKEESTCPEANIIQLKLSQPSRKSLGRREPSHVAQSSIFKSDFQFPILWVVVGQMRCYYPLSLNDIYASTKDLKRPNHRTLYLTKYSKFSIKYFISTKYTCAMFIRI